MFIFPWHSAHCLSFSPIAPYQCCSHTPFATLTALSREIRNILDTEKKRRKNSSKILTKTKKGVTTSITLCSCERNVQNEYCTFRIPLVSFQFNIVVSNRRRVFFSVFLVFFLRFCCVDLYIDMGLDSRPKICFALHVHTSLTHTHTHTVYCIPVIISSIRVGLLFLDEVDVFIFVFIRFTPEGNNSMFHVVSFTSFYFFLYFFASHHRRSCRHFLSLGQWCVANRGRERSPNAIDHKNDYPRSTNFMMENRYFAVRQDARRSRIPIMLFYGLKIENVYFVPAICHSWANNYPIIHAVESKLHFVNFADVRCDQFSVREERERVWNNSIDIDCSCRCRWWNCQSCDSFLVLFSITNFVRPNIIVLFLLTCQCSICASVSQLATTIDARWSTRWMLCNVSTSYA